MQFNPINKTLYTDDGILIKILCCPYTSLAWDDLSYVDGSIDRFCDKCESNVVETKVMSDEVLLDLLQRKPDTCLKIDPDQENIRINTNV